MGEEKRLTRQRPPAATLVPDDIPEIRQVSEQIESIIELCPSWQCEGDDGELLPLRPTADEIEAQLTHQAADLLRQGDWQLGIDGIELERLECGAIQVWVAVHWFHPYETLPCPAGMNPSPHYFAE
jgi:hypothetical protein